jgi:peptide/nickel transport system ATP-binding protein
VRSPLLQVEGLRAHFFTPAGVVKAIDDVSFSVCKGEVLAIVGESGCGKSCAACSITGLLAEPGRVVGGRITFDGGELRSQTPKSMRTLCGSRIAVIFAQPGMTLDPASRVEAQMLEAVLAHQRVSRGAARERAGGALTRWGIAYPDDVLRSYAAELPADVRHRVAIALALVNDPELIIADAPTTCLDGALHSQVLGAMQTIVAERGAAIIWLASDLADVAGFADRVCVMYAGRVVEEGAAVQVLGQPAHPYTRGLLDSVPSRVPPGTRLRAIAGMPPRASTLPSGCAFRERCSNALRTCVAAPEMLPIGAAVGARGVRCHNPLPIVAVHA